MKIAIEGMDGVGKTTLAKKIAAKYEMQYLEKPLTELFKISGRSGETVLSDISSNIYSLDDEIIKAWFFGMGNLYSFINYKDTDLVLDRHFASNYFWNGTARTDSVFKTMIELIGVPDITILLYASVETRMKRLYKRDPNDCDLFDSEKRVLGYDKMIEFLDRFTIPYVIVNTDDKNIDQVCDEACNIIGPLRNKILIRKLGNK